MFLRSLVFGGVMFAFLLPYGAMAEELADEAAKEDVENDLINLLLEYIDEGIADDVSTLEYILFDEPKICAYASVNNCSAGTGCATGLSCKKRNATQCSCQADAVQTDLRAADPEDL